MSEDRVAWPPGLWQNSCIVKLSTSPAQDTHVPHTRGLAYKWIALSNTTIGVLMATINASILLIALPDIFRGIKMDPLAPGNTSYFLWILMGFRSEERRV